MSRRNTIAQPRQKLNVALLLSKRQMTKILDTGDGRLGSPLRPFARRHLRLLSLF